MFIGRREDKTIYGLWTVRQWEGQEELPDDDPEVLAFSAPSIDQQIAAIYAENPITPRGASEVAYGLAQYRDIHNAQVDALVAVIRQLGGPSFADFDVLRIPDLKKNKGMVDLKDVIDRTSALRSQKT